MVCPVRAIQAALALVAAAAAGANLSFSVFIVPRLLESPPALMLRQWRRSYESGKAAFVSASALVALAQVGVYLVRWRSASRSGRGAPSRLPLLAAALASAPVPYTLAAMLKTNRALMARSDAAEAGAAAEAEAGAGAETETARETAHAAQEVATSRYLVDRWGVLNLGRSVIWAAAATAGVAAVL